MDWPIAGLLQGMASAGLDVAKKMGESPSEGDLAPSEALRVFVSYSRIDMELADQLVATLERNGFVVTIDRRDLPYGEEWQAELQGFIATADSVVWLISPDSVRSKWCNWELGEVTRLSKRLIPIRIGTVEAEDLPQSLGRIHVLPVTGLYSAALHEAELVKALNSDGVWLKKATSLGERARDWVAGGRDRARMLRGGALAEAEAWSVRPPRNVPAPSSEILELIIASRRAQRRRQGYTVAGSIIAAILAAGLGWYGLDRAAEATEQRLVAERNEATATAAAERATQAEGEVRRSAARLAEQLKRAQVNESRYLAERSSAALMRGDLQQATSLALEGLPTDPAAKFPDRPLVEQASVALEAVLKQDGAGPVLASHVSIDLPIAVQLRAPSIFFNNSGSAVIGRSDIGATRIWDAASGAVLRTFTYSDPVTAMAANEEARTWAVATGDGRVRLIDMSTFDVIATIELGAKPFAMALSAGGRLAVALAERAEVWDISQSARKHVLVGHKGKVTSVQFSESGQLVLTGSEDKTARVWSAETGVESFKLDHPYPVYGVAMSEAAGVIATGSTDQRTTLFRTDNGAEQTWFEGYLPTNPFSMIDGKSIIATLSKGQAASWRSDSRRTGAIWGKLVEMYRTGDTDLIQDFADLATEPPVRTFKTRNGWALASDFSSDGRWFATGEEDGSIRLWDLANEGAFVTLDGHSNRVSALTFSSDSRTLASASFDGTVRLWGVREPQADGVATSRSPMQSSDLVAYARASAASRLKTAADSLPATEVDPRTTECDKLATYPYDPAGLAPGVWSLASSAVQACEAAVKLDPNTPRLRYLLGRSLMGAKRFPEAVSSFKAAADGGDAMALTHLAFAYLRGYGVESDPAMARKLFSEALSRGASIAGSSVGRLFWDGEGGNVDKAKAIEIWKDAAAMGDPFSHERLAWVAELGRDGSAQDLPKALYHYAVAVKLMEEAGDDSSAVAPRYRRASLARIQEPELVAAKWREAMAFKRPTSHGVK